MAKNKNTGLGRGLDAIFLDNSVDQSESVTMLRLSDIEPNPDQPRRQFDQEALAELAASIAANGLIQPIVVRSAGSDGYYQIIAGERRWRASKMAGLTEVPVRIMELNDKKAAEVALIENLQREDLNAIETADAFKLMMAVYKMTQEELAREVGMSRSLIANTLRLLDLPDSVCDLVREGKLSQGQARTLLSLKDREMIPKVAEEAVKQELTVRSLEQLVKKLNKAPKPDKDEPPVVDYNEELAKKMTARLGSRVKIIGNGKNRKLEIAITDDKMLDELVTKLCGENIFDD